MEQKILYRYGSTKDYEIIYKCTFTNNALGFSKGYQFIYVEEYNDGKRNLWKNNIYDYLDFTIGKPIKKLSFDDKVVLRRAFEDGKDFIDKEMPNNQFAKFECPKCKSNIGLPYKIFSTTDSKICISIRCECGNEYTLIQHKKCVEGNINAIGRIQKKYNTGSEK